MAVNENSMLTLSQYGVELVKEHLTTISKWLKYANQIKFTQMSIAREIVGFAMEAGSSDIHLEEESPIAVELILILKLVLRD